MSNIDFDARYSVKQYPGVAFYLVGWEKRWEPLMTEIPVPKNRYEDDFDPANPYGEVEWLWVETDEGEWVEDPEGGQVIAVMVGDDRNHVVDVGDLTLIDEDQYCAGCGQIGPPFCFGYGPGD